MRGPWLFVIIMLGVATSPATAVCSDTALDYNQVEFSVQAEEVLPNDLAEVVMAAQSQHGDPAQVAKDINETMTWALSRVHAVADIAASSGGYQTYPVYEKDHLHHWRGIQTLVLRSKRIEPLNTLVGELQQRLQVQNMRFTVSPEQRQAAETRLIDQALDQFKARAHRIQQRLGAGSYEIVSLRVDASGNPPPIPLERMTLARAASAAPVAGEAGTSRQTLSVHAVIQLRF